jgi:hypothetical protein
LDKIQIYKLINEVAKEFYLDDEDVEVRSYSGRGMYGKECLGIVCDNPHAVQGKFIGECIIQIIDIAADVKDEGEAVRMAIDLADDIKVELINKVKMDSMGLQKIIYWENIPYVK